MLESDGAMEADMRTMTAMIRRFDVHILFMYHY